MSSADPAFERPNPSMIAGWLPGIETAIDDMTSSGRVRLPLLRSSLVPIAKAIQQTPATDETTVRSSPVCTGLVGAMREDPGLLIWQLVRCSDACLGQPVRLTDLAVELWLSAASIFAAASVGEEPTASTRRWQELHQYFATLPRERWLQHADLWLNAGGLPADSPIAKRLWQLTIDWDRLDSDETVVVGTDEVELLRSMARMQLNTSHLNHQFDAAVVAARRDLARQLAYGLSHEINNPLASITSHADALRKRLESSKDGTVGNDTLRSLDSISEQTRRAFAMLSDLMFYARPPTPELEMVDVRSIIMQVTQSVAPQLERANIRWQWLPTDVADLRRSDVRDEKLPALDVMVDPGMCGDAIAALVQNAMDSIQTGGCIGIRCHRVGSNIHVDVCDTGGGCSVETRRSAMDPFFSGRESGRGLGLGLCRASRIAELFGGSLTISTGWAGCVAKLILPAA